MLTDQDALRTDIERAMALHRAGRLAEATAIYKSVLAVQPDDFNALHLLGLVAFQDKKYQEAIQLIERALKSDSSAYTAFNNLGLAYRAAGNVAESGRSFSRAVELNDQYVDARYNLARLFLETDDAAAAAAEFRRIVEQRPDYAEAHHDLGVTLHAVKDWDGAVESYQRALALKPEFAEAHCHLATTLQVLGKTADALAAYQHGLMLNPNIAEAQVALGSMLQDQGFLEDALECFSTALALRPDYVEARWQYTMSQLALVYGSDDDQSDRRRAFAVALTELNTWFDDRRIADGHEAVGSQQPFFLAYIEQNNRALLSQYGDLCARLMDYWRESHGISVARPVKDERIRLGIVSGHVRDQSVWTAIVRGWCEHLDKREISLHIFYTGGAVDQETEFARTRSEFLTHGARSLHEWVDAIAEQRLDAIIFPEIGMDPVTVKLASLRLAPVQIAAWGHPETTGLPTMDYYLSAEAFEPEQAQDNYREKLVQLPNLGCAYRPLDVATMDLDLVQAGLDPDSPILICAGTPMKYAPWSDGVLARIAQQLGRCQFVFFNHFKGEPFGETATATGSDVSRGGFVFLRVRCLSSVAETRGFLCVAQAQRRLSRYDGFFGIQYGDAGDRVRVAGRRMGGALHAGKTGERHAEANGLARSYCSQRNRVRGAGGALGSATTSIGSGYASKSLTREAFCSTI